MSANAHQAVFLSYAREDTAAARRIADALRAFGIEVWFDQNELRGGDTWDQKIRQQIKDCTLFVAIISDNTQTRREGYFRREWNLAVERTLDMAQGTPFLMPVVIDDTAESAGIVPEQFMRVQWTRLAQGVPTPQFVEQVKRLLAAPAAPAVEAGRPRPAQRDPSDKLRVPSQSSDEGAAPPANADEVGRALRARLGWIAAAVIFVGAGGWILTHRNSITGSPSEPAAQQSAPPTPAPSPSATKIADSSAVALAKTDKSIAVLPFTNMSEDKDASAFFADGVHEDILTNLALIPELKVVSRTTVTQYRDTKKTLRQVGEELGVSYILEGSVRRVGNKVRVTGQLINARTDEHVWAKKYDRDITDVFAIQASLADEIATALQAAITPEAKKQIERRPTENLVAYDAFLKGRETTNNMPSGRRSDLIKAEGFFQTAVDQDPKFAAAWGQLAEVHARFSFYNWDATPERIARGEAAIANALRLAPEAPDVIRSVGTFTYYAHRDYPKATAQYEKIARLQPNDPTVFEALGLIQRRQGHWAESLANLRKATELDPGNPSFWRALVQSFQNLRRWDEAIAGQRRLVAMLPDSRRDRRFLVDYIFCATGSRTERDALLTRETAADPNSPLSIFIRKAFTARDDYAEFKRLDALQPFYDDENSGDHAQQALGWAVIYAAHGDLAAARTRLADFPADLRARVRREPTNPIAHYNLAKAEALLGNRDEAVKLAEKAMALLPESRDAVDGSDHLVRAAEVFAWTSDKGRAIALLTRVLQVPSGNCVRELQESPQFAPLRGDPRFEALLNDPKNSAPLF